MGSGATKPQDANTYEFFEPLPSGTPLHYTLQTGTLYSCASPFAGADAPPAANSDSGFGGGVKRRGSVTIGGVTLAGEKPPTKAYKLWHQILYPAEPNPSDEKHGSGGARKGPSAYRGILVFCHGVLEHSSRYLHVMTMLAGAGFVVAAQDHLSHGRSEDHEAGGRGYASFFDVQRDNVSFINHVVATVNNLPDWGEGGAKPLPLFLWGQSWGGGLQTLTGIELQHQLRINLSGVILTSPALEKPDSLMLRIQAPFGVLVQAIKPDAKLVPGAPPTLMSSVQKERERYINDPLNSPGNLPVLTGQSSAEAFDVIAAKKSTITFPLLAIHGSLDQVLDNAASQRLVNSAQSTDKEFVLMVGMWHTCLHEPEWEKVYSKMKEFLDQRAPVKA